MSIPKSIRAFRMMLAMSSNFRVGSAPQSTAMMVLQRRSSRP